MRRWLWAAAIAAVAVLLAAVAPRFISDATVTAARFSGLRNDQTALRAFLQRMPKGGDLHVHLSGAVYAERLVAFAAADELCVRLEDMTVVEPPCNAASGTISASQALKDQTIHDRLVNAMSMRAFVPSANVPTGHDQFFAAFDKFGNASSRRTAEMTLEMLVRYDADEVQYAEFMVTFADKQQRQAMSATIGEEKDLAAALEKITSNLAGEVSKRNLGTPGPTLTVT